MYVGIVGQNYVKTKKVQSIDFLALITLGYMIGKEIWLPVTPLKLLVT